MGLLGCCLFLLFACSVNCQFFRTTDILTKPMWNDVVDDDLMHKIFMDQLTKTLRSGTNIQDLNTELLRKKMIMSKIDRVTRKDWLNDVDTFGTGKTFDTLDKKKLMMLKSLLTKGLKDDCVTDLDIFHLMHGIDTNLVDDKTILLIKLLLKKIQDVVVMLDDQLLTKNFFLNGLTDDGLDTRKIFFIKKLMKDLYTHDIMDTMDTDHLMSLNTKDWDKKRMLEKFMLKDIKKQVVLDDDDDFRGLRL